MEKETYRVRISKDYLVFSAAHFITFGGSTCEQLHGHNYRVAAEVQGPLDADLLVVDFIWLRDALGRILEELDHRVLLATENPTLDVAVGGREVEVTFADRRWVFPKTDCVLLPVGNATAEMLARHIGRRLIGELESQTGSRPELLRIEIDECHGQSAVCELRGG